MDSSPQPASDLTAPPLVRIRSSTLLDTGVSDLSARSTIWPVRFSGKSSLQEMGRSLIALATGSPPVPSTPVQASLPQRVLLLSPVQQPALVHTWDPPDRSSERDTWGTKLCSTQMII